MPVNEPFGKMDEVLQKLFSGDKDFAKLRLMFLKFGGVLNSVRAEEGSGEESARASFRILAGRARTKNYSRISFSSQSIFSFFLLQKISSQI